MTTDATGQLRALADCEQFVDDCYFCSQSCIMSKPVFHFSGRSIGLQGGPKSKPLPN